MLSNTNPQHSQLMLEEQSIILAETPLLSMLKNLLFFPYIYLSLGLFIRCAEETSSPWLVAENSKLP